MSTQTITSPSDLWTTTGGETCSDVPSGTYSMIHFSSSSSSFSNLHQMAKWNPVDRHGYWFYRVISFYNQLVILEEPNSINVNNSFYISLKSFSTVPELFATTLLRGNGQIQYTINPIYPSFFYKADFCLLIHHTHICYPKSRPNRCNWSRASYDS